ncbi:MAG TPA: hypothetical protein VFR94_09550 [Nitrososphaeraceae archaeon]|nr:hypothetical protein [Nitrososphaeraceae archaeon]
MNNITLVTTSAFLLSVFLFTGFMGPLFGQQKQNQTGSDAALEIENFTGGNLVMMQSNISNTSLIEGLQSGQKTAGTTNQTGEAGQMALSQTGQPIQATMNQTEDSGQVGLNGTGEALSNASKAGIVQNGSQGGQAGANQSVKTTQSDQNNTGDILNKILRGEQDLFE